MAQSASSPPTVLAARLASPCIHDAARAYIHHSAEAHDSHRGEKHGEGSERASISFDPVGEAAMQSEAGKHSVGADQERPDP